MLLFFILILRIENIDCQYSRFSHRLYSESSFNEKKRLQRTKKRPNAVMFKYAVHRDKLADSMQKWTLDGKGEKKIIFAWNLFEYQMMHREYRVWTNCNATVIYIEWHAYNRRKRRRKENNNKTHIHWEKELKIDYTFC